MSHLGSTTGRGSRRRFLNPASRPAAAALALLVLGSPLAAAPPEAVADATGPDPIAQAPTAPDPVAPTAAGFTFLLRLPPAQPDQEASTAAGDDASPGTDHVSAGMPVWKLLTIDARSILTAPVDWTAHDWAVFGIGVGSVATLTLADKHLRAEALRGDAPLETTLANDFRYFGNYAAFGVLGAFYAAGGIAHDAKAQETALDGLIASILGGGVITTAIKEVAGRSRPATHQGVYTFHPFSGNASFPSGESTEAFAVGSVIAAHYPDLWVEIPCYGTASLVAFARMREDGHWASDVVMGALIGTTVGRAVVHLNQRLRARVHVAPLLAPGAQGLTLHAAF